MSTRVVNLRRESYDVDITRRGKWGNPFSIGKDGARDEVITAYMAWFGINRPLQADLRELEGKDLVCWCSPLPCHADILLELANRQLE
ncbi:hypothetical protein LCGC14_2799900 [marine sediment metagenome]|uniref:DUF4326 domain-containing protein n=1 Tax=marine sediment metagenome TaxID=412755 RepID=A0A0F8ZA20_9ZZZZ